MQNSSTWDVLNVSFQKPPAAKGASPLWNPLQLRDISGSLAFSFAPLSRVFLKTQDKGNGPVEKPSAGPDATRRSHAHGHR
ncbi:hypothetical protein JCM15519_08970 [Fundidesulfovibrio butyratiphilus]